MAKVTRPQIDFKALITQCETALQGKNYVLAYRLSERLTVHFPTSGRVKKIHSTLTRDAAIVSKINAAIATAEPDRHLQQQLLHLAETQAFTDLLEACQRHLSQRPHSVFLNQLAATAASECGQWGVADTCFIRALAHDPLNAGLMKNYAIFLKGRVQFMKARDYFYFVCQLAPTDAESFAGLAALETDLKNYQMAEPLWLRAIALAPHDEEPLISLFSCLIDQGKYSSAQKTLSKLKQISGDSWKIHLCQAYAERRSRKWKEALASVETAESLAGPLQDILLEKANIFRDQHKYSEAHAILMSASEKQQEASLSILWNLSFCALMTGDFDTGWHHYENRWHSRNWNSQSLETTKPRWTGTETGRILIWNEQGIGDEIMFFSLLAHIPETYSDILVRCDKRIVQMLERAHHKRFRFIGAGEELEPSSYDYHLPAGSLPYVLGFNPRDRTYQQAAYLKPTQTKKEQVSAQLTSAGTPVIGVSWKSTGSLYGTDKNIELSDLLEGFSGKDVHFVTLQYGDVSSDLARLTSHQRQLISSFDEIDKRDDLEGLAALIVCCDAIITSSNATAHLASALGVPCHVILRENHDWKWHQSWERSYWYPECRIHRITDQMSLEQILKQIKTEVTVTSTAQT